MSKLVMAGRTLGRLAVVVAVVVIAAAGLCLFDGDEVGSVDLCAASVAATLMVLPVFSLPMSGHALPALARIRPLYAPDLPAPPPKV